MQTALSLNHKQSPFTLVTRPVPLAGPGEVLIRVRAVALNPVDWKIQKWDFLIEEYPAVLGWDMAGDVIAVGEGVTRFSIGDKVFGQGLSHVHADFGGYQEYAKLKEDFAAKIPANITYEEASAFPVALSAAFIILYNSVPNGMGLTPLLPSGQNQYASQPILIIGGASSVGQFTIQLAKASGFSPIITTSSLKHVGTLKALGATHVIDRTIPLNSIRPQIAEILASTSAPGVESEATGLISHIYDAISDEETQKGAYDLLAPGGILGLVLAAVVPTDAHGKTVVSPMAVANLPTNISTAKTLYSSVNSMVEDGTIRPSKVEVLPGGLGGIVGGLKRLEEHKVSGVKLVVLPDEH